MVEKTPSIVKTIQEMIRRGESEENIIQALRGLGLTEEKAKMLLLVSQADTLALLQTEVSKLAKETILEEEENLKKEIRKELEFAVKEAREEVEKSVSYYADKRINEVIEVVEALRKNMIEQNEVIEVIRYELKELRAKGGTSGKGKISTILMAMGTIFLFADLFLFYQSYFQAFSLESIIMNIIFALAGISMLFTASFT